MKDIPFSIFNTNERFLFLQLLINILQKKLEELPALQNIFDRLVTLRNSMETALHKNTGSAFTATLNQLDDTQDNGFRCFRYGVTAQSYSIENESLHKTAEKIEAIIRRHGWSLFKFGKKKQLAVSRSLMAELKQPENLQIITELGLTAPFEAWCEAVATFEATYTQKVEESATKDSLAAYEIGKEVVDLLEKLLPGWYYQGEFSGEAAYKELVNAVVEGADDIEAQARARATRRANQKKAEMN